MNNEEKGKTNAGKVAIAIFLTLFACMLTYVFYKGNQIRRHFAFTSGRVTRIYLPRWGGSQFELLYEYTVNGEVYGGNCKYSPCFYPGDTHIKSLFLHRDFPVVYAANSPSGEFLVLTQDRADKYHYQLPDSVRAIDAMINCN